MTNRLCITENDQNSQGQGTVVEQKVVSILLVL